LFNVFQAKFYYLWGEKKKPKTFQNKFSGSSQAQKITVQLPDDIEVATCRNTCAEGLKLLY